MCQVVKLTIAYKNSLESLLLEMFPIGKDCSHIHWNGERARIGLKASVLVVCLPSSYSWASFWLPCRPNFLICKMITLNQVIAEEASGCGALWLIVETYNSRLIVCAYLVIVGGSHEEKNIWTNCGSFQEWRWSLQELTGLMLSGFPSHQSTMITKHHSSE